MKDLMGKTVLQHVIERVQLAKSIDEIIIATTTLDQDDVVVDEAVRCGVSYFRGSENDVLARYYGAAKGNNVETVVRITSDCPLIDPFVIDDIINFFKDKEIYDIVTNASSDLSERTYPRGLDTEVFSFQVLENAYKHAGKQYQREHVTPYIYENTLMKYCYKNISDYSMYRWTLDTEEDFALIKELYRNIYKGEHNFYFMDILKLFEQYPELIKINQHIEQKVWR